MSWRNKLITSLRTAQERAEVATVEAALAQLDTSSVEKVVCAWRPRPFARLKDRLFDVLRNSEERERAAKARVVLEGNQRCLRKQTEAIVAKVDEIVRAGGTMDLRPVASKLRESAGWPTTGPVRNLPGATPDACVVLETIEEGGAWLPIETALRVKALLDPAGVEAEYFRSNNLRSARAKSNDIVRFAIENRLIPPLGGIANMMPRCLSLKEKLDGQLSVLSSELERTGVDTRTTTKPTLEKLKTLENQALTEDEFNEAVSDALQEQVDSAFAQGLLELRDRTLALQLAERYRTVRTSLNAVEELTRMLKQGQVEELGLVESAHDRNDSSLARLLTTKAEIGKQLAIVGDEMAKAGISEGPEIIPEILTEVQERICSLGREATVGDLDKVAVAAADAWFNRRAARPLAGTRERQLWDTYEEHVTNWIRATALAYVLNAEKDQPNVQP